MGKRVKRMMVNKINTSSKKYTNLRQFVQDFNTFFSGLGLTGPRLKKGSTPNKYMPHQGAQECERRRNRFVDTSYYTVKELAQGINRGCGVVRRHIKNNYVPATFKNGKYLVLPKHGNVYMAHFKEVIRHCTPNYAPVKWQQFLESKPYDC